jgi:3-hydroxymyristoyl/3-hydroxydecanoyl-(acyl carrier protein) dehydratase
MAIDLYWRQVERRLALAHPAADGHFPGNPIIPGAALLAEILDVITADGLSTACEIRQAKFLQPVRPGDLLVIRWRQARETEIKFEGVLEPGGLALSGVILTEAAP